MAVRSRSYASHLGNASVGEYGEERGPFAGRSVDAAMSRRAECVMLNKGPFIVETVQFLSGVLERMTAHQSKKSSMLRRLAVSQID